MKKKPQSYEESQENLRESFKELGKSLDKSFKITPLILGLTKKTSWIERKIADYNFKLMLKKGNK